jgi:hypothetical protein
MRNTLPKDYEQMLKLAKSNIGKRAVDVMDEFTSKRKVVFHRAAKVFWTLVEEGKVSCKQDSEGYEIITA